MRRMQWKKMNETINVCSQTHTRAHLRQRELCVFISHSLLLLTGKYSQMDRFSPFIHDGFARPCAPAQKRNDIHNIQLLCHYAHAIIFWYVLASRSLLFLRCLDCLHFKEKQKKSVHYSIINWLFVFIVAFICSVSIIDYFVSMDVRWVENKFGIWKNVQKLDGWFDEYSIVELTKSKHFAIYRAAGHPAEWNAKRRDEKEAKLPVQIAMKLKDWPGETW